MNEITKRVALNAYEKHFSIVGLDLINENFVKAYKINRVYVLTYKFKSTIQVMLFGEDKMGTRQNVCLGLDTFKFIQNIDMKAVEILFKGDKDA